MDDAIDPPSHELSVVAGGDVIDQVDLLPRWELVLNAVGQPFGGLHQPTDVLVLSMSGRVAGARDVYLLATPDGRRSHRFAALVMRLFDSAYRVVHRLTATDEVLRVVMASWLSTHAVSMDDSDSGAVHERWDALIQDAYAAGASDIHLRVAQGRCVVRRRIHGELENMPVTLTQEEGMDMIRSMYSTMVDKGSTRAGFDERSPQSAKVTRTYSTGRLRLRYEHLTVEPDGLSVTLRLIPLGVNARRKTPSQLGYSPDQERMLERAFAHSAGLILFVGTTGSGKSTSMANCLMGLVDANPGKLLRTVEEPVEITIPGADQTPVARTNAADTTGAASFNAVLASIMRSDPDYLMVGEIRDADTANLAVQAVRSGHLCVSTLHALDAPTAYDRLIGMGLQRTDVASVGLIVAIVYQRLVPVLCKHCRVPVKAAAKERETLDVVERLLAYMKRVEPDAADPLEGVFFRSREGCGACHHRGITGRTVCAEILVPTPGMLRSILDADSAELWRQWRATIDPDHPELMRGRTAFEHALWKMRQGVVSPADVEREFRPLDEEVFR